MCLLLFVLALAAEEPPFDKSRHPWAKFPIGSWVRIRITKKTTLGKEETVDSFTITRTLTEVKGQHVKLEVTTERPEGTIFETQKQSAPYGAQKGASWEKLADNESLSAAGEQFTCQLWKATVDSGELVSEMKVWISPQVQGSVVKYEIITYRKDEEQEGKGKVERREEIILCHRNQAVTIKGKSYNCDVFKITSTSSAGSKEGNLYLCEQVPGFSVKVTSKERIGALELSLKMEVEDFGLSPQQD
jgi:hypothetical protein